MNNLLPNTSHAGAGEHLFLSEDMSDIVVLVKSNDGQWRFPAHRLILATQSSVFRVMLENDFTEKVKGEILIEDIKPHIIELLLKYMYCGKAVLENWYDSLDLLRAAHKYQVDALVQHCARFLESVISISNVCCIYDDACLYSLVSLREKCLKLILDAGFIVLRSKAFERLSKEAVMEVITNRELNIDSELMVFKAMFRWAPMQCCRLNECITDENTLKELTPFLKYVCFDDMSDTEKSELPSDVLSCVKPNNRNRVTYHVNESLLSYAYFFTFKLDHELVSCVGDQLNCLRFSLDSPKYLLGLKFTMIVPQIPEHFLLFFVKECANVSYNVISINMARAVWKEGMHVNEGTQWETQILMRQPCPLEERHVYKFYIETEVPNAFCPKMILANHSIMTDMGQTNLSLHCESVFGITHLITL